MSRLLRLLRAGACHHHARAGARVARSAGARRDSASPWGFTVGQNGGGPCYSASAFHAFGLRGLSVSAMGAIERGLSAERLVAGVFDYWSELDTDQS